MNNKTVRLFIFIVIGLVFIAEFILNRTIPITNEETGEIMNYVFQATIDSKEYTINEFVYLVLSLVTKYISWGFLLLVYNVLRVNNKNNELNVGLLDNKQNSILSSNASILSILQVLLENNHLVSDEQKTVIQENLEGEIEKLLKASQTYIDNTTLTLTDKITSIRNYISDFELTLENAKNLGDNTTIKDISGLIAKYQKQLSDLIRLQE